MNHAINACARRYNLDEINLPFGCDGENLEGWINIDDYDYEAGDFHEAAHPMT